jgi:dTMP kinase
MFIVIEGADISGKTTQYEMLLAKFKEYDLAVRGFSFPRYETDIGEAISRHLKGKLVFLDSEMMSPGREAREAALTFQALQSLDKLDAAHDIRDLLQEGIHVIACRWWQSCAAYGVAMRSGLALSRLCSMHKLLPQADLNVLLTVPEELSVARRPEMGDFLERNREMQGTVREVYTTLWENDHRRFRQDEGRWVHIDSTFRQPSTEEIHKEIWNHVMALFSGGKLWYHPSSVLNR